MMNKRKLPVLAVEVKKVGGLFCGLILVVLFTANLLTGWWTGKRAKLPDRNTMQAAIDIYIDDPSAFLTEYEVWETRYEDWFALALEASKNGNNSFSIPSPVEEHGEYTFDEMVYRRTLTAAGRNEEVLHSLDKLITEAEINVSDPTNARHAYNARVATLYKDIRDDIYIGFEDARGWDLLLGSPWQGVTSLLVVILFTGRLFSVEYESGMAALLYSSRFGRRRAMLSKILLSCIAAFIFLAVSFVGAITGIGWVTGFSSLANGIQTFSAFTFCPATWSVFETLLTAILVKWGAICLFVVMTALCSVRMKNLPASVLTVFGVVLACFLGVLLTQRAARLLYAMNPMTAIATADEMTRFYAVFPFGIGLSLPLLYLAMWLTIVGFFLLLILMQYSGVLLPSKLVTRQLSVAEIPLLSKKPMRDHTSSLIIYEFLKHLTRKKIVLILLFLFIQALIIQAIYGGQHDVQDRLYEEYMTTLAGEISQDKTEYLMEERARFDEILSSRDKMEQAYAAGTLTTVEFGDYVEEYEIAYSHSSALDRVILRDEALREDSQNHNSPAWFVYESGYENIILSGGDLFLLLTVVFLVSDIFPIEHRGRSSDGAVALLIRSTKRGRKPTAEAKTVACLVSVSTLYCFSTAVRFGIIAHNWTLPSIDAPAYSLERFVSCGNISIAWLMCLIVFGRLLVLLLYAGITLFLTHRLQDGTLVFVIFAALILSPTVCRNLGIELPAFLDLVSLYNLFLI